MSFTPKNRSLSDIETDLMNCLLRSPTIDSITLGIPQIQIPPTTIPDPIATFALKIGWMPNFILDLNLFQFRGNLLDRIHSYLRFIFTKISTKKSHYSQHHEKLFIRHSSRDRLFLGLSASSC